MTATEHDLRICCTDDGTVYRLRCSGAIDASASMSMRDATLRALSSRCPVIVIDLADVPLVDSAGLTSLRLAHKAAEIADVELRLEGANPLVARTLRCADAEYLLAKVSNVRR
jgi:anti-anti-sigma factor